MNDSDDGVDSLSEAEEEEVVSSDSGTDGESVDENVLDLPDNDNRRRSIRRDTTQNDYPKQSHRVAPNYVSEWRSVSEDTVQIVDQINCLYSAAVVV